jgi:hypothetical protein
LVKIAKNPPLLLGKKHRKNMEKLGEFKGCGILRT